MRLLPFLLLLSPLCLSAQPLFYYHTDAAGEATYLQRIEIYADGKLAEKVIYLPDGTPTTRYRYTYAYGDQPTETITTNLDGHEWDVIYRDDYDERGRLVNRLHGNNYNGNWGSHGYRYNTYGDVDTINYYGKDGKFYRQRIYDYTYDERGRKTSEQTRTVELADHRLISTGVKFGYTHLPDGLRTTHTDTTGTRYLTETVRYDGAGRVKIRVQDFAGGGQAKTRYVYDTNGRIRRTEDYYNGTRTGGSVARTSAGRRWRAVPAPDGVGEIYRPFD